MTRRLGLASLLVVAFALGGASAGPVRPLQALRLVVSIACLGAPEERERETPLFAERVAQRPATAVSRATRSDGFRSFPVERWLFQRPPPAVL
jgi:hypothetical protein